jgi:beta-galactosidase
MNIRKMSLWLIALLPIAGICRESGDRERIRMDAGWRFALGHAFDAGRDFGNGTGYFSWFAKAGYGDGPAVPGFDDRGWRILDLPHDWCVELPFDARGGHSHGYKSIGRNFPENSIGWYRKTFFIPESDLGKRVSIEFDGVHRNSIVWANGFYLGNEHSGYTDFAYDITDYLNYGGENFLAVRVDATMEEGWYFEGAGIYRHVWLVKTSPLHVARHGTFVTTDMKDGAARITIRTTVANDSKETAVFSIEESIAGPDGDVAASGIQSGLRLDPGAEREFRMIFPVVHPKMWSVDTPDLYRLKTVIRAGGKTVDVYETSFGIRTVRFDPDKGFFLNGKQLKIKGTNNHQDHAGVGTAIPDALQEFRILRLKQMGSNAIRTSHNPPAPELLDACDRLGMLVLDENRLMGINDEHLSCLERLMKRDRNHPSVILWSLGNEEWAIEGNIKGARIASTMQAFAQRLDSSRAVTAASSGGWDGGIGTVVEVMGYNYMVQGDIDAHHAKFPWQSAVGTEESNTIGTRGVYVTDDAKAHMAPTRRMPENVGTESGWKYYLERPFLAGLFYWTGFDYRGESNPYGWPAVSSQFGILDLCGFPKDIYFYLRSWWQDEPVLRVAPHWDWPGHEGRELKLTVYSNCEQVELSLNGKSLGRKDMPVNGHLEWSVIYQPGVLTATGYRAGRKMMTKEIRTTGNPSALVLAPDRNSLKADGRDVSVITVQAKDSKGLFIPTAGNEIQFQLEGPGKIIGVGNGDPSSHEADRYFETVKTVKIENLKECVVDNPENRPETAENWDDSSWEPAFRNQPADWRAYTDSLIVVRGSFDLPELAAEAEVTLLAKSIATQQSIYVNGNLLASDIPQTGLLPAIRLKPEHVHPGKNSYALTGKRFRKRHQWDEPNQDPGAVQVVFPAARWRRNLFNGLAQIIVQSASEPGTITLTASSPGLKGTSLKIRTQAKQQ